MKPNDLLWEGIRNKNMILSCEKQVCSMKKIE